MTTDVWSENQAAEMFKKIARMLRDYRKAHNRNFVGILHISIRDMQAIADVTEVKDAARYNRAPKFRKYGHGDQVRIQGVRVMAHKDTPLAGVGFDAP